MNSTKLEHLSEENRIALEKHYSKQLEGKFDDLIATISEAVMRRDSLALFFIARATERLLEHASDAIERAQTGSEYTWTAPTGFLN